MLTYHYPETMFSAYGAVETSTDLYFPTVYDTGGWRNYLSIINPSGTSSAHITVKFLDVNGGEVARDTATIPPYGKYHYTVRDIVGEFTGSIIVESDQLVAGMLTYHYPNDMFSIYEAFRL
jgi:hypothetical protein